jgi:hypothetical protein
LAAPGPNKANPPKYAVFLAVFARFASMQVIDLFVILGVMWLLPPQPALVRTSDKKSPQMEATRLF